MWQYDGKNIEESEIPTDAIGFLYKITHIESGKWYIGRKMLYSIKTTQKNGKKIKNKIDSDWRTYWSSSKELQDWVVAEGEDKFIREILIFVKTKAALTYAEEAALYMSGALFNSSCINGNIRSRIMKCWFKNKETDLHIRLTSALFIHSQYPTIDQK